MHEFIQRLQIDFPEAQMIPNETIPDPSISEEQGQFIQIINVDPIPDDSLDVQPISEKSVQYYQMNDIKRFRFDLPDHEHKTWVKRKILETFESLPNILRWSEIDNR